MKILFCRVEGDWGEGYLAIEAKILFYARNFIFLVRRNCLIREKDKKTEECNSFNGEQRISVGNLF